MRTLRILCSVACALVVVVLVATSGQASTRRHHSARKSAHTRIAAAKQSSHAAVAHTPGSAGMVVAVDQATGQLRMPTADEMQTLAGPASDLLNESGDGLVQTPLAHGGTKIDLQGRFQDFAVARVGADGKLVFGCGKTPAAAMSETQTPQAPSGALEVK